MWDSRYNTVPMFILKKENVIHCGPLMCFSLFLDNNGGGYHSGISYKLWINCGQLLVGLNSLLAFGLFMGFVDNKKVSQILLVHMQDLMSSRLYFCILKVSTATGSCVDCHVGACAVVHTSASRGQRGHIIVDRQASSQSVV